MDTKTIKKVKKKMKERRRKKKAKKAKKKPRPSMTQTVRQSVVVNIGAGAGRKFKAKQNTNRTQSKQPTLKGILAAALTNQQSFQGHHPEIGFLRQTIAEMNARQMAPVNNAPLPPPPITVNAPPITMHAPPVNVNFNSQPANVNVHGNREDFDVDSGRGSPLPMPNNTREGFSRAHGSRFPHSVSSGSDDGGLFDGEFFDGGEEFKGERLTTSNSEDAFEGEPEAPPKAQTPKTKVKPLRSNNRGVQDDEQEKTQTQLKWEVVTNTDTFKRKKKKGGVSKQIDWNRWAEIGNAIGSPAKSKKELMASFNNRNRRKR
jgi:hypothetical protein